MSTKHVATLLPKPSTQTTPSQPSPLESHIANLALTMIHALNTRDFNPSSPAWTPAAPTTNFPQQPSFHSSDTLSCNLAQWLEIFSAQIRDHPEHFFDVKGTDVQVNAKRDLATVFVDFETRGEFEDVNGGLEIVRRGVAVAEFVLVGEGGWKCRKWRCLPGLG